MSDTGSPDIGVDFVINFGDSFGGLKTLDDLIGTTQANAVREFNRIQQAVSGGLGAAEAAAQYKALGSTAAREARTAAQEAARAEKAGEALVRQLERQNATFGRSRDEVRAMRVEEAALAAERTRNTDLAGRLRSELTLLTNAEAEAIATANAQAEARREASKAFDMFEAAARRGMAATREQEAAEAAQATRSAALASAMFEKRARDAMRSYEAQQAAAAEAAAAEEAQMRRSASVASAMFEARAAAAMRSYREQEAAEAAQMQRSAALASAMFEARAREGAIAMREQEAAALRDADALARLRAMIDPAAAAQDRLNAELADARRLMTAAGMSAEEMTAAMDALWARSQRGIAQHSEMAVAARKSGFALQTVALQLPDITQGLLTGQPPMTVFIQQGFQIVQVAQMAEGGLRGFGKELVGLSIRFAPLLVALAAAGAGVALFTRWVNQGVTNEQLTRDLGKITGGADATKQEMFKLKDATVSFGSTSQALFSVLGKDIAGVFVGDMKAMGRDVKSALDEITGYMKASMAAVYAGVAGTKAYLGEVEKGGVLGIGKMLIGQGDPALLEKTYGKAYAAADKYLGSLGARVRQEAVRIERQKLADKIGFNNAPAVKTDKHAEQLDREARAVEAQIKGLYALADAYGVSGAAALIAEAQVKAETAAITKRGEVDEFIARQIRLAVAQRVSDAEKGAAAMRDQARIQAEVNGMVAAGTVPAEHAADIMRDRIADLPLLAALEAAQQKGLTKEAERATKALEDQRDAQARAKAAAMGERFVAADRAADDRLADLREELRLVGATDAVRTRALVTLRATREAQRLFPDALTNQQVYIDKQLQISDLEGERQLRADAFNASLVHQADLLEIIASNVSNAGAGLADALGAGGRALGDMTTSLVGYMAQQERAAASRRGELVIAGQIRDAELRARREQQINAQFAARNATAQVGLYGDLTASAKSFFKEGSDGYRALATAEKVFRGVEFALSVRAVAQDAIETASSVAKSGVRAAAHGVEAVAKAIASLPFPANLAAGAATAAALAAIGISIASSFGGGGSKLPKANDGSGTVFGDADAKSESLKRSIDQLHAVDTVTSVYARQMATSLRSIDSQIGGFAAQIVRAGDVNASTGVNTGFKADAIGSILGATPLIGGFLKSLFGTKTTVVGGGLYGGAQSVGDILSGGFDASTYSDAEKKKKFLGLTTSKKFSTVFGEADADLERQFTLILSSFAGAIGAAAGPLGENADAFAARLNGFVLNIGKVDLKGLTGTEIQERLEAIFGAAADGMAEAAMPGITRFQKAGEGAFETLVRVGSTVEAVDAALAQLGGTTRALGKDAKIGLADQFDAIGDLTSAVGDYFAAFYTPAEQAAARAAQLTRVFGSMNLVMPDTLNGFRLLVDAQDLTTDAGRATYAELLRLAPAFADLKRELEGTKSAADVLAERGDLERELLELRGDTAALRALDLAKLDASNRGLQEQIWAVQDAQEAAKAAEDLRQAWGSVGDGIRDEIARIRGLTTTEKGGTFAQLLGRFNATNAAARGGDIDAAKSLPQLSQALLTAAGNAATSRQELDRVQTQTAAQLEATYAALKAAERAAAPMTTAKLLADAAASQAAASPAQVADDSAAAELRALREEVAAMRRENREGHAATAGEAGGARRVLERAEGAAGGVGLAVTGVAA